VGLHHRLHLREERVEVGQAAGLAGLAGVEADPTGAARAAAGATAQRVEELLEGRALEGVVALVGFVAHGSTVRGGRERRPPRRALGSGP
jgi:hypothetical protein